jgi:hypothetical protein
MQATATWYVVQNLSSLSGSRRCSVKEILKGIANDSAALT